VLSRGRVVSGSGSRLEEELRPSGVDRGARTEESIAAIRELWSKGASEHRGTHYSWSSVESNPKPVQARIPIVIGGHTKGAARRAARVGDGFFPARPDTLAECLVELEAECARVGRNPSEIEITTGCLPKLEEVKRLEAMGVGRITSGRRDSRATT
jgi:alkanesulfonate monooxygenase SsuD/methylene tetrahydromethanopterin reductase-like flavin-dependent oxidoreductase (luciferase family)